MTSRSFWQFQEVTWEPIAVPRLMGIVNVTPDSFSDGGKYFDLAAAIEQGIQLESDGAAILDVGGESTRPGAAPVSADEELRRVIPVITGLSERIRIPISIDTMKATVAQEALQAGASVVNDVTGLAGDPLMEEVCAGSDCGIIAMHMQGTPQTMQAAPHYNNVVEEIRSYFETRLQVLQQRGISSTRVMFDPGIGFGKTAEHNLQLLSHLSRLRVESRPLLIGHSRKRFLKRLLGREVDERSFGTLGVSLALASQGVELLRVHEIVPLRDALIAWHAVMSGELDSLR